MRLDPDQVAQAPRRRSAFRRPIGTLSDRSDGPSASPAWIVLAVGIAWLTIGAVIRDPFVATVGVIGILLGSWMLIDASYRRDARAPVRPA